MSAPLTPTKRLLRLYVALTGSIAAYTLGLLDSYTPEHRRFLSSGFVCGSCKEFLLTKTLMAEVIIYDGQGNEVPMLQARAKGKYFACPKCGYKWEIRRNQASK